MKAENLKLIVKEKYGEIASQSKVQNQISCCGSTCGCNDTDFTIFTEDYSVIEGYNPEADLGLGCGIPTKFAKIKKGDHVLDLGSGAGNDCFVARSLVGDTGKVTGIDFTDEMLEKAYKNVKKMGYTNIDFIKGDIENMPVPDNTIDVVLSNCVINLVPDKAKAFFEIYRVLKKGGHFCISDIVLDEELPAKLKNIADMYAGCVSGALVKDIYLNIIKKAGFGSIQIQNERKAYIPDEILHNYLSETEIIKYKESNVGIYSITVTGIK